MVELEIIELIGLDRAKPVISKSENLLESEVVVLNQVKNFGIDSVLFQY